MMVLVTAATNQAATRMTYPSNNTYLVSIEGVLGAPSLSHERNMSMSLSVEQAINVKKLVKLLRSGEYKQANSLLKAVPHSGEASYCCLGVAAEGVLGVDFNDSHTPYTQNSSYKLIGDDAHKFGFDRFITWEEADKLRDIWTKDNQYVSFGTSDTRMAVLMRLNDSNVLNADFNDIADTIEAMDWDQPDVKSLMKEWLDWLRVGSLQQTRSNLKKAPKGKDAQYCCLGVAAEKVLHLNECGQTGYEGIVQFEQNDPDNDGEYASSMLDDVSASLLGLDKVATEEEIEKFVSLTNLYVVALTNRSRQRLLAKCNDDGLSFPHIATVVVAMGWDNG